MMYDRMSEVMMCDRTDIPPKCVTYHNFNLLDKGSPDHPEGSFWKCLQCNTLAHNVWIKSDNSCIDQQGDEYNG